MQNYILFKLLPEMLKFRQISGIRLFSFELQYSYDQRNAVACNSVIEESSFHSVNAIVRNYLSCSRFQQLVNFSLRIYFWFWV